MRGLGAPSARCHVEAPAPFPWAVTSLTERTREGRDVGDVGDVGTVGPEREGGVSVLRPEVSGELCPPVLPQELQTPQNAAAGHRPSACVPSRATGLTASPLPCSTETREDV